MKNFNESSKVSILKCRTNKICKVLNTVSHEIFTLIQAFLITWGFFFFLILCDYDISSHSTIAPIESDYVPSVFYIALIANFFVLCINIFYLAKSEVVTTLPRKKYILNLIIDIIYTFLISLLMFVKFPIRHGLFGNFIMTCAVLIITNWVTSAIIDATNTPDERYSTSFKMTGTDVQVDTVIHDEIKDTSLTLSTTSLDEVEFINTLLQMLKENPSLPIFCRVDGEIIDDNELCKIGRLRTYRAPQIDACSVAFENKIIVKSDGDYDIWFQDLFGDEHLPDIDNIYEYKKKRVDAAVDWQEVILLEIYTP